MKLKNEKYKRSHYYPFALIDLMWCAYFAFKQLDVLDAGLISRLLRGLDIVQIS